MYIGGDGFDTIGGNVSTGNDFSEPNADIAVSLDGVANDGEPGEGDNVMPDVERVKALGRNVTMIGSDAANELIATADSSTIRGLGGDDRLIGADGADSLEGGEGADYLEGGFGPDVLDGGGGVDQFVGDKTERDVIASGNDQIRARDGLAEQINCGIGSDSAIVDAADVVDPSCEAVDRGSGPCCVPPVKPGDPKVLGKLSIKKIAVEGPRDPDRLPGGLHRHGGAAREQAHGPQAAPRPLARARARTRHAARRRQRQGDAQGRQQGAQALPAAAQPQGDAADADADGRDHHARAPRAAAQALIAAGRASGLTGTR